MDFSRETWVYNVKWVPDLEAARLLFNMTDVDSYEYGQRPEPADDRPIDLAACRIVSISAVIRRTASDGRPTVLLYSLPELTEAYNDRNAEEHMLDVFFRNCHKRQPTLITSNPLLPDLRSLIRRAVVKQVRIPGFYKTLDTYLSHESEKWRTSCDLAHVLGIDPESTLSLPELARLAGIPAQPDQPVHAVFNMWREGFIEGIIQRNEWDVLTHHLLWLRFAHFAGSLTDGEYEEEQELVREHLLKKARQPENSYLQVFLEQWAELNAQHIRIDPGTD